MPFNQEELMPSRAGVRTAIALIFALFAQSAAAQQSATGQACSLLPKEDVRKILGADKKMFDLIPPQGDALAGGGSSCEYMSAGIQIDPFTPKGLEDIRKKSGQAWVAIPNVGDAAYFHDRTKLAPYMELYVRKGTHVVTVQMSADTPDEKANARARSVELAKALLSKLR
jgi:hypothetical protein